MQSAISFPKNCLGKQLLMRSKRRRASHGFLEESESRCCEGSCPFNRMDFSSPREENVGLFDGSVVNP